MKKLEPNTLVQSPSGHEWKFIEYYDGDKEIAKCVGPTHDLRRLRTTPKKQRKKIMTKTETRKVSE